MCSTSPGLHAVRQFRLPTLMAGCRQRRKPFLLLMWAGGTCVPVLPLLCGALVTVLGRWCVLGGRPDPPWPELCGLRWFVTFPTLRRALDPKAVYGGGGGE